MQSVAPLSTLDGFRLIFRLNTEDEGPHYLRERGFRRALLALGWTVAAARPTSPGVDADTYGDLAKY